MRRLSPSGVVAVIALIAALAGTGYAASKLPRNSVTSKQVKNHSLLKKDFKNGQLPRGKRGPRGAAGLTSLSRGAGPEVSMCGSAGAAECRVKLAQVSCPSGTAPTGGGWDMSGVDF